MLIVFVFGSQLLLLVTKIDGKPSPSSDTAALGPSPPEEADKSGDSQQPINQDPILQEDAIETKPRGEMLEEVQEAPIVAEEAPSLCDGERDGRKKRILSVEELEKYINDYAEGYRQRSNKRALGMTEII